MSSQQTDEMPQTNSAPASKPVSFAERAEINKRTMTETLAQIINLLNQLPSNQSLRSLIEGLSFQLDDLNGTTAQKSDVIGAIKSASETGMAKGFAAGQADTQQEMDAIKTRLDNTVGYYTSTQRLLQAGSIDLNGVTNQLAQLVDKLSQCIVAQNALTQAVSNGLDVRAEELAPAVAREIKGDLSGMLTELDTHVVAATRQFTLSQNGARDAITGVGSVARSMQTTVIAALGGLGSTAVLLVALPGLWRLIALIPVVVAVTIVFLRKDSDFNAH